MAKLRTNVFVFSILLAAFHASAPPQSKAASSPGRDHAVQTPELAAPGRGSLAGTLAAKQWSANDVVRGTLSLPFPGDIPQERGPLHLPVLPTYNAEQGLTEWGLGWGAHLTITRTRLSGEVQFDDQDAFASPWGCLARGDDGAWYPADLRTFARATRTNDAWTVVLHDGTRATFSAANVVRGGRGIFAWYVDHVEDPFGYRTDFRYEQAGGRPYLAEVSYGGQGGTRQHRLRLQYEAVPKATVRWDSGGPVSLDRRVARVVADSRHARTGQWGERFSYVMQYRDDALGPAFFLAQIIKTYASGAQEPPVTFRHAEWNEELSAAAPAPAANLQAYLDLADRRSWGGALDPRHVTFFDADADGRTDVENAYDHTLLRLSDTGWDSVPLPSRAVDHDAMCRPVASPLNRARTLARLVPGDREPYVFNALEHGPLETQVVVCSREGRKIFDENVPGAWALGSHGRLVDLNRDHAPDLLWVGRGSYRVLPNISTPAKIGFGEVKSGVLYPAVQPEAAWVHDINGDGIPDIVVLTQSALLTWYGRGNYEFANEGVLLPLRGLLGPFTLRPSDEVYFTDANRDGVADLLVLVDGRRPTMFVGDGTGFHQHAPKALDRLGAGGMSGVVFGDFSGDGETQLAAIVGGRAMSVDLGTPATGLLTSVDDGKGTTWTLGYRRAPAEAGTFARHAVLAEVVAASGGRIPDSTTFTYRDATVHSESWQLVGFGHVGLRQGTSAEEAEFLNDDRVMGLPLRIHRGDHTKPTLRQETELHYRSQMYQGLPVMQEVANEQRLRDLRTDAYLEERKETVAWANPWCPAKTVHRGRRGKTTREIGLASVPALLDLPHCLPGEERIRGEHGDPALDFSHRVEIERDAVGKVTRLMLTGTGDAMVLQEVGYDDLHRVASITVPGQGQTKVAYDTDTGQIAEVTSPDGTRSSAKRQPVTDQVVELTKDRGAAVARRQGFAFDAMGRLAARWDESRGTSATAPFERLSYRFATATHPGMIQSDLWMGTGVVRRAMGLFFGDGSQLSEGTELASGWRLSGWTEAVPSTGASVAYRGQTMSDPAAATYNQVMATGVSLGGHRADALGNVVERRALVQSGLESTEHLAFSVRDGLLWVTETDSLGKSRIRKLDADQQPVETEEGTAVTRFVADAAGRLRRLVLPDGSVHAVAYDAQGRVTAVERSGVGALRYAYVPGTDRLKESRVLDRAGSMVRTLVYEYDAVGRQRTLMHATADRNVEYEFFYDGLKPDGTVVGGQVGFLTGVRGPGFEKRMAYNADGTLHTRETELTGWRSVQSTFSYLSDGTPQGTTTVVADSTGGSARVVASTELDSLGRPNRFVVNGNAVYEMEYDGDGRVAAARLNGGGAFGFARDPQTKVTSGVVATVGGLDVSLAWDFDAARQVVSEDVHIASSRYQRSYAHDGRGFLSTWHGHQGGHTYAWDALGLTPTPTNAAVEVDAQGRLVRRGAKTFEYDAAGHIVAVDDGHGRRTTYVYDELGNRILKGVNGVPSVAFIDGDVVTDSGVVRPVDIDGWRAGVLQDGKFVPVLADRRGTTVVERTGQLSWRGPFGEGTPQGDDDAYAGYWFDRDTETFRMGLRDYDPMLRRFITPDPLFLAQPGLCAADPVQCNLFSYAQNQPLEFTDPSGLIAEDIWGQCSTTGQYHSLFRHRGADLGRSETPGQWHLRNYERGGVQSSLVQPDVLLGGMRLGWQLSKAVAMQVYSAWNARLFAAGMTDQALGHMLGQHMRVHSFEGVQAASRYLIEQGVPRKARVEILQSFVVGTIKFDVADSATFGLRFYGGGAQKVGAYLFPSFTNLTNRPGLALAHQFNSMDGLWGAQVARGTQLIRGVAAPQLKFGSQYVGGEQQIFILMSRAPGVLQ